MDINAALMQRNKLLSPPAKRKRTPTTTPARSSAAPRQSSLACAATSDFFSSPSSSLKQQRSGDGSTILDDSSSHSSDATTTFKKPRVSLRAPLHSNGATGSNDNSRAPLTRSPAKANAAPTLQQSYIDVGQKSFGAHTTCRACGLLYTIGEQANAECAAHATQEDEKEHRRFCKVAQKGLTIARWKNERLVCAFADENCRIIEIRHGDPPAHIKKLLEIKQLLDDALGAVDNDAFLQRSAFVFVHDKQIVGCATAERVAKAFALDVRVPTAGISITATDTTNTTDATCAREASSSPAAPPIAALTDAFTASSSSPRAVLAGVCQLWVHPAWRHKHIATRLVDSLRAKLIYGHHVAKHELAFAQPTADGRAFAEQYVAPSPVLVYDSASAVSRANGAA